MRHNLINRNKWYNSKGLSIRTLEGGDLMDRKITIISVLAFLSMYGALLTAYLNEVINGYFFIAVLLMYSIVFITALAVFSYKKRKEAALTYLVICSLILLLVDFKLINYESYTYTVLSHFQPIEVSKNTGIHLLVVNNMNAQYIDDKTNLINSLAYNNVHAIETIEITNKDRYISKNREIMSMFGVLPDNHFENMGQQVEGYLGEVPNSVQTFLKRTDLLGDSAGLGLALAGLIEMGAIENNVKIAVTGTIHENGDVLPIGAIKTKLQIAEEEGFAFALIPSANVVEAMNDFDLNIKVYEISNIEEAIQVIKQINENN